MSLVAYASSDEESSEDEHEDTQESQPNCKTKSDLCDVTRVISVEPKIQLLNDVKHTNVDPINEVGLSLTRKLQMPLPMHPFDNFQFDNDSNSELVEVEPKDSNNTDTGNKTDTDLSQLSGSDSNSGNLELNGVILNETTEDSLDNRIDKLEAQNSSLSLSSQLPQPKKISIGGFVTTDPSTIFSSANVTVKSGMKRKVLISIPSLSEFKEEESDVPKKKFQPSMKGSGLFSILPAPRNSFFSSQSKRQLVPDSVQSKRQLVPDSVKKSNGPKPVTLKPVVKSKSVLTSVVDSDDEDDMSSLDFFSLTKKDETLVVIPPYEPLPLQSVKSYNEIEEPSSSTADYIPFVQDGHEQNLETLIDDNALVQLTGRTKRRREEINVIDVHADALYPDKRDWLVKTLTQEPETPPKPPSGDDPSSTQRRKHQITYLAFQAKTREIELKNQWADNRQSRRQTQSKYGF